MNLIMVFLAVCAWVLIPTDPWGDPPWGDPPEEPEEGDPPEPTP